MKTIKYMALCVAILMSLGCKIKNWSTHTNNYKGQSADIMDDIMHNQKVQGDINVVGRNSISITRHTTNNSGADKDPDISIDGKYLLFSSTRGSHTHDIYMKQIGTNVVTQLTNNPAEDIQPKFSTDGRSIVFASNRHESKFDIYILPLFDRNGKRIQAKPIQVTNNRRHNIHGCFNPRGDKIVYSSKNFRSQSWELWVYDHNERTHSHIGFGLLPDWSPDGTQIVYEKYRNRGKHYSSIWICNEDGSNPSEIMGDREYGAITPSWSPDGRFIAYATVHKSQYARDKKRHNEGDNIWYIPVKGGNAVQVTNHDAPDSMPIWKFNRNGKAVIFFISGREDGDRVWSAEPYTPGDLDNITLD